MISLTDDMATSVAVALIHSRHVWTMQTRFCTASLPVIFLSYSVARTRPPVLFYNNHPLPLFIVSWTDFTGPNRLQNRHTHLYNALTFGHPAYLRELIYPYQPSRLLRSSKQLLLTISHAKLAIGQRAFSYSSPVI